MKKIGSLLVLALILISAPSAFASEHIPGAKEETPAPAKIYNGNTPIDHHGLLFNNGTFGVPNEQHEEWAHTPVVFPGISEKTYSYEQKAQLINGLQAQLDWGNAALSNYKAVTADVSKDEGVAHAKHAVEVLTPALDRLQSAYSKIKGAAQGDWSSAQDEARRALIDFRMAYTQMHKNIRM